MKTLLIDGVKIAVCSGVLLAAYRLLLDRRVPLSWCRRYLLALPFSASLIPLLRIPLLPASVIEPAPVEPLPVVAWVQAPAAAPATFPLAEAALVGIWLAGTLVLLAAMLRQIGFVRRLRCRAVLTSGGGFRIASTPERIAPFSFRETIYLWAGTAAEERRAIIAHETSHIAHHHSTERIVMECMKALLWWNPFVWMAARRLTETQEYEADRDVLAGGYDRQRYMNAIFKQLFGYSPDIANGLHDSLTKKRFQMMTTHFGSRHALLRLAGAMLAMTALLCAFSLTARAAEVRMLPETEQRPAVAVPADERPEPLYIVNGEEKGSKEEAFDFGKMLSGSKKGCKVSLRNLMPEEAVEKYGEKGRNGVVEITVSDQDEAAASTVPDVVAARFGEAADVDEPYLVAETMPRFRGGDLLAFRVWVQEQLRYPDTEAAGRVVVAFIVERDGSMGPVEVVQSPDDLLTAEVLRVLKSVPAGSWTPGTQRGEPVRVRYAMPVEFRVMTPAPAQEQ